MAGGGGGGGSHIKVTGIFVIPLFGLKIADFGLT